MGYLYPYSRGFSSTTGGPLRDMEGLKKCERVQALDTGVVILHCAWEQEGRNCRGAFVGHPLLPSRLCSPAGLGSSGSRCSSKYLPSFRLSPYALSLVDIRPWSDSIRFNPILLSFL